MTPWWWVRHHIIEAGAQSFRLASTTAKRKSARCLTKPAHHHREGQAPSTAPALRDPVREPRRAGVVTPTLQPPTTPDSSPLRPTQGHPGNLTRSRVGPKLSVPSVTLHGRSPHMAQKWGQSNSVEWGQNCPAKNTGALSRAA